MKSLKRYQGLKLQSNRQINQLDIAMTDSQNYECPNCQSENIQKLSLAVMHGTKSVSFLGIGGASGGAGGGGMFGTSQSALAELNSPPKEKSSVWWSIGIVIFGLSSLTLNPIPIFLFLGCCFGLWAAWSYNSKEYPALLKDWNEKWICQRCATVFKLGGEFRN